MWQNSKRPSHLDRGPGFGPSDPRRWREAQLRRAGFDSGTAAWLATEPAVDLHALIELVERGCPPPLAARIMAPLDHEAVAR